jgi:hypothetical protein
MMVRGLTEDQVHQAVASVGVTLNKPPRWYRGYLSFTIRARSREDRARGYRELCARIFELNPEATIPPCYVGQGDGFVLLYPVSGPPRLEEPTITPEHTVAAAGVDAAQWAAYNRRYCALLGGMKPCA